MQLTVYNTSTDPSLTSEGTVVTTDNILEFVEKVCWSPAIFKNNHRKKENFIQAECVGLDVDGGLSLEDAILRLKSFKLEAFVCTSRSHQKEKENPQTKKIEVCDRFRIIFLTAEPIKSGTSYTATFKDLFTKFPESDAQVSDASRMFFPSKFHTKIEGNRVVPVESTDQIKYQVLPHTVAISKNVKKVIIGSQAVSFLADPDAYTAENVYNAGLNKTMFALARGGMSRELAVKIMMAVSPKAFSEKHIATFNSGWNDGVDAGFFAEVTKPDKLNQEDLFKVLEDILKSKFCVYEDDERNRALVLEIYNDNMVKKVSAAGLETVIAKISNDEMGAFLDKRKAENVAKTWIMSTEHVITEPPKSFLFTGETGMTYNKLDVTIQPGPTPTFDEFISRCSNANALSAFLWSIFEQKSDRQQYLWLMGEGQNGKSSFLAFIEHILGENAMCAPDLNTSSGPYFTSTFLGKRLAVISDTNSRTFIQSGTFKQLTGSDLIPMREIYGKPFASRIDTKFIIVSNNYPSISDKKADQRRIILTTVKNFDPSKKLSESEYHAKWVAEAGAVLYKCREIYNQLVVNHSDIPVDTKVSEALALEDSAPYDLIIERHLKIDENESLSITELCGILKIAGLKTKKDQADFREYLSRRYAIISKRYGTVYKYKGVGKQ